MCLKFRSTSQQQDVPFLKQCFQYCFGDTTEKMSSTTATKCFIWVISRSLGVQQDRYNQLYTGNKVNLTGAQEGTAGRGRDLQFGSA